MPLGSKSCRIAAACLVVAALAACSGRPFPVTPPKSLTRTLELAQADAARTGAPMPRLVSICYGKLINTPEELLEEARYACQGGDVTFQDADSFWTPCGLFQPIRASFFCTPKAGTQ